LTVLSIIVLIFVFGIPIIFAVQPLFGPKVELPSDVQLTLESLKRRKRILYQQIKELELEYGLGLIPEAEFSAIRNTLKQKVSGIMTEMNPKK
jgi:hypothetical protein